MDLQTWINAKNSQRHRHTKEAPIRRLYRDEVCFEHFLLWLQIPLHTYDTVDAAVAAKDSADLRTGFVPPAESALTLHQHVAHLEFTSHSARLDEDKFRRKGPLIVVKIRKPRQSDQHEYQLQPLGDQALYGGGHFFSEAVLEPWHPIEESAHGAAQSPKKRKHRFSNSDVVAAKRGRT